jgi:hypothetical protein
VAVPYLLALVAFSEAPGVVLYHLVLRGRRRLPARLPWLGGRRVPRLVAVAPMALAAVLLVAIGLPGAYQSIADFDTLRARMDPGLTGPDWALTAQMFHFAVWGLVLGSAVLAHLLRSRPRFHVLVQPD